MNITGLKKINPQIAVSAQSVMEVSVEPLAWFSKKLQKHISHQMWYVFLELC